MHIEKELVLKSLVLYYTAIFIVDNDF